MIQHISAVTLAVSNMSLSVEFYRKLGFELVYGGEGAAFSTLKTGQALVNLSTSPGYESRWWGESFSGSVTSTSIIGPCWHEVSTSMRRKMPLGAKSSFTSPIQTATNLALPSCCQVQQVVPVL